MLQTDSFNQHFAYTYIKQLQNLEVYHSPAMLSFSAMPGSGKTTLARRLAADLQAVLIEHDAIRELIRQSGTSPESLVMSDISRLVVDHVMQETNNKFIILDASIDRGWQLFLDHAKRLGAKTILIRMQVPPVMLRQRIFKRDGRNSSLLHQMPDYLRNYNTCRQALTADLTLAAHYDYPQVLDFIRQHSEWGLADNV